MRCTLVLFNYAAFERLFPMTGFESTGIDRFAISWFGQQTWQ